MINIINKLITNITRVISELELCYKEHENNNNESLDQLKVTTEKLDEIALRLKILSIMYMEKYKTTHKPCIDLSGEGIMQSISLN